MGSINRAIPTEKTAATRIPRYREKALTRLASSRRFCPSSPGDQSASAYSRQSCQAETDVKHRQDQRSSRHHIGMVPVWPT